MSTGTKVFLAVFALLIMLLVVYYGFIVPGGAENELVTEQPLEPNQSTEAMSKASIVEPSANTQGDYVLGDSESPGEVEPPTVAAAHEQPLYDGVPTLPADARDAAADTPTQPRQGQPIPITSTPPRDRVLANPDQPATIETLTMGAEPASPPANDLQIVPNVQQDYKQYIVRQGDTMSDIAANWFEDPNKWHLVARANPQVDPNKLIVGQRLRLPPRHATADDIQSTPRLANSEYIVQPGDTLSSIAKRFLGDGGKWKYIHEANVGVIGANPNRLKVGMKLKIPATMAAANS